MKVGKLISKMRWLVFRPLLYLLKYMLLYHLFLITNNIYPQKERLQGLRNSQSGVFFTLSTLQLWADTTAIVISRLIEQNWSGGTCGAYSDNGSVSWLPLWVSRSHIVNGWCFYKVCWETYGDRCWPGEGYSSSSSGHDIWTIIHDLFIVRRIILYKLIRIGSCKWMMAITIR